MTLQRISLVLFALFPFAAGCGEVPSHAQSAITVETLKSLPACDADREGQVAYVSASAELLACVSGEWVPVPRTGACDTTNWHAFAPDLYRCNLASCSTARTSTKRT